MLLLSADGCDSAYRNTIFEGCTQEQIRPFGKGGLLDLLDASRSRTALRINYLDLLEAETQAELEVLRAAGLLADRAEREAG